MLTQDLCQQVCKIIGSLLPATESEWLTVYDLTQSLYYDINYLQGQTTITWELTPSMQYWLELTPDQLELSVCTEFITEIYQTYYYIEGMLPYADDGGTEGAIKIVLHGIRCIILFFEHQLWLDDSKTYENFKKYMHI